MPAFAQQSASGSRLRKPARRCNSTIPGRRKPRRSARSTAASATMRRPCFGARRKTPPQDMKLAASQKREFHQHFFSRSWATVGQSVRLLSLESATGTFTGGAHPNSTNGALLWDRRLNREIRWPHCSCGRGRSNADPSGLLQEARRRAAQAPRRRKARRPVRRMSQILRAGDRPIRWRQGSPLRSHPFRRLSLCRRPLRRGAYEIDVPVSRQLMAAIKPAYRASFEPQRQ